MEIENSIKEVNLAINNDNISKITEEIYVGNENSSKNYNLLNNIGIKGIVRIGKGLSEYFKNEFFYFGIDISDEEYELIEPYFHDIFIFMKRIFNINGKIFIHCRAGISRSITVAASFYIRDLSLNVTESIEFLKVRRSISDPNIGFKTQLCFYYFKLNYPKFKLFKSKIFDCIHYINHLKKRKRIKYSRTSLLKEKKKYFQIENKTLSMSHNTILYRFFQLYVYIEEKIVYYRVKKKDDIQIYQSLLKEVKDTDKIINSLFPSKKHLSKLEKAKRLKNTRNFISRNFKIAYDMIIKQEIKVNLISNSYTYNYRQETALFMI